MMLTEYHVTVRVASRMLTDELLQFLIDNANRRYTTDPEVCPFLVYWLCMLQD